MIALALLPWLTLPSVRCTVLSSSEFKGVLIVPPSLQREVVMLPHNPSESDLNALATALHADLKREGERWRISRDSARRATLERENREWMKSQIAAIVSRFDERFRTYAKSPIEAPYEAMKAARAEFDARSSENVSDESGAAAVQKTPAVRLVADLVRDLPPELLAAPPGRTTVFSNRPVGIERGLVIDGKALEAYLEAQNRFASWSEAALADGRIPPSYAWAFPQTPFRIGERTLHFYVNRSGVSPGIGVEVYDSKGSREAGGFLFEQGPERRTFDRSTGNRLGKVSLPEAVLEKMAQATPGNAKFQPSLLDPVTHEPLDGLVREALSIWAKAKGHAKLIGCVPDALMEGVESCVSDSSLDLDALEREIRRADCEFLPVGDALVLRPLNPLQEEAIRTNRRPLSTFYKKAVAKDVSLSDVLAYHAAYSEEYGRRLIERYERSIRRAFEIRSPYWNLAHPFLATLGSLTPSERQTVWAGGRAPLRTNPATDGPLELARYISSNGLSAPPPANVAYSQGVVLVTGSDLERSPTRLLAQPGGIWILGERGPIYPLVRRVERESGQVVDASPRSFSDLTRHLDRETAWDVLDRNYRFLWTEGRLTLIKVTVGQSAQMGPVQIRERGPESKSAVPLAQVPGGTRAIVSGGRP